MVLQAPDGVGVRARVRELGVSPKAVLTETMAAGADGHPAAERLADWLRPGSSGLRAGAKLRGCLVIGEKPTALFAILIGQPPSPRQLLLLEGR
jgi:hypothetical protein